MTMTRRILRSCVYGSLASTVLVIAVLTFTVPDPPHFSDSVVQVTRLSQDGQQNQPYASAVAIRVVPEGTFFLTAKHVTQSASELSIRPNDLFGIPVSVVVISESERSDLALLFVPGLRGHTLALFGEEDPGFLDSLTLVGRTPFGLTVTRGELNHRLPIPWEGMDWLTHTAHVHGGCSGGGLFNADGRLIGINVAVGVQGFSPVSHVAMAVPLSEIRRFLREGK